MRQIENNVDLTTAIRARVKPISDLHYRPTASALVLDPVTQKGVAMATTQAMLDAQQALLESSEALRAAFDANISAMNALTRELSRQVANKPEPQEMFVTPREVADLLHKNEQTVRRMCRDGQLAGAQLDGGRWIIDTKALAKQYGIEPSEVFALSRTT